MSEQTKRPEIRGKIVELMPLFTSQSGFTKREAVVETGFQYPNPVLVTFTKDRVGLLDGVAVGDFVTVTYAINGRKWDGPNGVRYFVDVVGLGLARSDAFGGSAPAPAAKRPALGVTKDTAIDTWRKYNPDDEDLKGFCGLCKRLKPGKPSKSYTIADWADIVNAIEGEAAAAAEVTAGDPDDLPF